MKELLPLFMWGGKVIDQSVSRLLLLVTGLLPCLTYTYIYTYTQQKQITTNIVVSYPDIKNPFTKY